MTSTTRARQSFTTSQHTIMRTLVILLTAAALIVAIAASTHVVAKPTDRLSTDDARHLLNRAGFAASAAEIERFRGLTRAEAAEKVVGTAREVASLPPPKWTSEPIVPASKYRELSLEDRQAEQRLNAERAFDLREWWFREMMTTPSPLTEKMTLFWHNHFATSQQKVRYSKLMYEQNVLLRKYALGNFGTMLHQMARDPAMLIYLDNANSRKEQPNENFAREVMELFTLGEGNYTEQDIKQMARAFTGWSIDRETGEFLFRRAIHDTGEKTIFGKRGNFEGDQALDLLLGRPETARFITRKLWREFVSPSPDENEVNRLAQIYRTSGYNTAKLMRAMLSADAFYAADSRASLIKSPVEFVVGTLKQFDIEPRTLRPYVTASALLGQNLLAPPNVKGWPGGENWINSASLLGRKQFIDRLFRPEDRMETMMTEMDEMADRSGTPPPPGRAARQQRNMERAMNALKWDIDAWGKQYVGENVSVGATAVTAAPGDVAKRDGAKRMAQVLLAMPPREMPGSGSPTEWVRSLVADPAYQLK
jgi:uncharacterized protein (DUF1800 family)